jgi:hypothetical protein
MAKTGASPVERLAKRQVQPILSATPKTVDPNDPWGVLGSTSVAPVATAPASGQNFVGPTLDPTIISKRAEVTAKGGEAIGAGVPAGDVASIVAGKGDPNRGFLGPAKAVGGFLKGVLGTAVPDVVPFTRIDISDTLKPVGKVTGTIGLKALTAANPALDKLDFGRRVVTSLLKEVGDEVAVWRGTRERGQAGQGEFRGKGGFSLDDFLFQTTKEGGIGGGEAFADIKNPYANQLLGFMADVFLDPLSYVSGPGGIAKTAVGKGAVTGSKKVAVKIASAEADRVAQVFAKKLAQEALEDAVKLGDNVAASAAQKAIANADRLTAQAERYLASQTAPRQFGRANAQALADRVLGIRDDAQKSIDEITARLRGVPGGVPTPVNIPATAADAQKLLDDIGRGLPVDFDITDAQQLFDARRTVEALTDDVIKDIQSKGLSGLAGGYLDIIKGVRTPAQEVLGVRGGLRIYNPLSVFPFGLPNRIPIKGTETITNVAGRLIADSRIGVGIKSARLLNLITPTGEGGLIGSEDIVRLRTQLRLGQLPADEAAEATRLLSLNDAYTAAVSNERKIAGATLENADIKRFDDQTLKNIIPYLQGAKNPATLIGLEKEAFDSIKGLLDGFYDYASKASGGAGFVPQARQNYFPQMQSDEAIRWASRNPKEVERLAKSMGVDRTWFVGNFRARNLGVDDMWFGTKLKASDLNVERLNQIAKDSGLIKFDYFDTNVRNVLSKYANTHAQFSALQKTLGELPERAPELFLRGAGGINAVQLVPGGRPSALPLYQQMGAQLVDIKALEQIRPQELKQILDQVKSLVGKIDAPVIVKQDFEKEMIDLIDYVDNLGVGTGLGAAGGISPALLTTLKDESVKLAQLIDMEARGLSQALSSVPDAKWAEVKNVINNGFIALNDITAPNILAKPEIALLFQNIQRISDPSFRSAAQAYIKSYNQFFKSYVTLRPGFAFRNLYSNYFQIVGAGATPNNIVQGQLLHKVVQKGLDQGLSPRAIATKIVNDKKIIKVSAKNAQETINSIVDAINYSGATGFGQYGEVAKTLGVGGRGVLRGVPRNSASAYLGKGIDKWQEINSSLEAGSRFILHWDGVKKGLNAQEAAARTKKFLIDYNDLSKLDATMKQVVPFWMFMSHNLPLQMQMMWSNPKAYAWYNSARRNLEDTRTEEEGGVTVPSYMKDRGAFATEEEGFGKFLPGNVITPGLPFPGGGESGIAGYITEPIKQLSGVSPLFRAPVEAFLRGESGEKFFTGGKVVPSEFADQPFERKLLYLAQELIAPKSPLASVVTIIPGANQNRLLQTLLGLKDDPEDPLTKQIASALQWGGLPFNTVRTEQQIREYQSRLYDLADAITKAGKAGKREDKQILEDLESVPVVEGNTEDPWGVLNP